VRKNIDPMGRCTDAEIWEELKSVKLAAYVEKMTDQLDTEVTENLFSVGQKQLLCLSRAVMLNAKMLVLDEATANVDIGTDNII